MAYALDREVILERKNGRSVNVPTIKLNETQYMFIDGEHVVIGELDSESNTIYECDVLTHVSALTNFVQKSLALHQQWADKEETTGNTQDIDKAKLQENYEKALLKEEKYIKERITYLSNRTNEKIVQLLKEFWIDSEDREKFLKKS